MVKAVREWNDGRECWYVADGREWLGTFNTREEATAAGAVEFIESDEPRFLIRDESGRGCVAEVFYTSFTTEDREYREESYDVDGNEEETQTFGEWLDTSSAGDEFDNSDSMYTVIRIN